jgi:hypothetical protein
MLNTYLTRTRQLLQNPSSASTQLYADADLTSWINQARGQLAGEAECCRVLGTVNTQIGLRSYNFSAINTGTQSVSGVQGVIHVRSVRYTVASGFQWVAPRAWEWFELYYLNNPVPDSGTPKNWAQYAQGSAGTGTGSGASGNFWIDRIPDMLYVLTCDCVCYPQPLAADTDVEAIPYLWTDAVPYFAAYLALLSSQTNARRADAEAFFSYYQTFVGRARQFANPSVLRNNYQQAVDQTQINKLGLQKTGAGG